MEISLKSIVAALLVVIGAHSTIAGNDTIRNERVIVKENESSKSLSVIYRSNSPDDVNISLFSGMWLLYQGSFNGGSFTQSFDLSNLKSGEYMLEIYTQFGKTKKIVLIDSEGLKILEE